jgi:hypothetical protein
MLHADFGRDGEGANKQSTLSITIGNVEYGERNWQLSDDDRMIRIDTIPENREEVVVDAHLLGSSRDNGMGADGQAPASTFLTSELFNTASGGGNPALVDDDGNVRTGRAGYFVLENFIPPSIEGETRRTPPDTDAEGGSEIPMVPLGETPEQTDYAILRLATAQGSVPFQDKTDPTDDLVPETIGPRTERKLLGFAAAFGEVQQQGGIGLTPVDAGPPIPLEKPIEPNLTLFTKPQSNKVVGDVDLFGIDPGAPRVQLGHEQDGSAFVDDDTFGVRTPAGRDADENMGEYAFVTAGILTDKVPGKPPRRLANFGTEIPDLRHVQWGFFLGERLAAAAGRGPHVREHVHMGSWATGRQLDPGELAGWAGSATFEGVALGNVFDGQALSTELGRYKNRWDFAARTGQARLDFDGETYRGDTSMLKKKPQFVGGLSGQNTGRVGRIDGGFVGHVDNFTDHKGKRGRGPTGLVGQFQISEQPGSNEVYRAIGTVAADRKKK